jgi:phosphate-selective porin
MFSDRARGGDFADVRDLGVMAHGSITPRIDYQAGVFNGLGETQNDVTTKGVLAVAARVVVRPGVPGLQLGASGGLNGRLDVADRRRHPFEPRNRLGVEGYYRRGRWTAQSELMGGRDDDETRLGTYALAAYQITPIAEIVGRVDYFDPDDSKDDGLLTTDELDFLLGGNFYLLENHLKLQANAIAKTFGDDGPASRLTVQFNFQVSW